MKKPLVAVSGKNGQLGWELQQLCNLHKDRLDFVFAGREELDLANSQSIGDFFKSNRPDYFINCAAYTAVDKAEEEKELAFQINALAVGQLSSWCSQMGIPFVTISTDYVFNGKGTSPYTINQECEPVNYYGYSKREGERLALANTSGSVIIRTSWVYSQHGKNFVKTMMRLMRDRGEVRVVNDQVGSPTYAADLAEFILFLTNRHFSGMKDQGVYHFSNSGSISWYEFALAIAELSGIKANVLPTDSNAFKTAANRPAYSVLDLTQTQHYFGKYPRNWKVALEDCIHKINAADF